MAYSYDKNTSEIIISGWEQGMAISPHKGIANIQCANISTEAGEAMCNYRRIQNSETFSTTGTLTSAGAGTTLTYAYTVHTAVAPFLFAGTWITVTGSTISGLSNGTYFILASRQDSAVLTLSTTYNGSTVSYSGAGTATFAFLTNTANTGGQMTQPVQSATEQYLDQNKVTQYRYYVLDTEGHIWVNDTGVTVPGSPGYNWSLIDITTARKAAYGATVSNPTGNATGMAVYNGWIFVFLGDTILAKETSSLGVAITTGSAGWDIIASSISGAGYQTQSLNSPIGSQNPHFAYSSKSGALYWTDSSFVGSIFATAGVPNLFSYASYTFSATVLSVFLIGGVQPYVNMPIVLTSSSGDSNIPTGVSARTVYYVKTVTASAGGATQITIAATMGGSAISLSGGGGTQYFNTFDPRVASTYIYSPQALTIPQQQDIAQCLTEIGSQILIGCNTNALYFWDGVAITPNGFLFLPENNTVNMITANNMAYLFSGSRGNIYITNGNTASAVATVPDYVTGLIDPYFSWGGAMYARGRIWFSIQDQNANHTGTCGGIWSFVPTQNLFIGQDSGLSLRIEHQSSYGNYNGMTNVLINIMNQNANGIQYFSAWTSSSTSPTYGIDASDTVPYTGGQTIIETDLVPIGNYLEKGNFTSIITKYAAQLVSGESVQLKYRNDLKAAWTAFTDVYNGTDSTVGSLGLRFSSPFANQTQVQFQLILTSTSSNPSFTRFKELRIKK